MVVGQNDLGTNQTNKWVVGKRKSHSFPETVGYRKKGSDKWIVKKIKNEEEFSKIANQAPETVLYIEVKSKKQENDQTILNFKDPLTQ